MLLGSSGHYCSYCRDSKRAIWASLAHLCLQWLGEGSLNWVMRPPAGYLTSAIELTSLAVSLFQAPAKEASTEPRPEGGIYGISCPVCPRAEPRSLGTHLPEAQGGPC